MLLKVLLLIFIQTSLQSEDLPLRLKSATGIDDEPVEAYELAKVLRVIKYSLEFEPFFPYPNFTFSEPNLSFKGYVETQFVMIRSAPTIWLNSERLKILKIALLIFENGQKQIKVSNSLQDNLLSLKTDNDFKLGKTYFLKINYTGQFYDAEEKGIFYKTYKSADGTKKTYISTSFQPTYSQRLFPHFNDPWFKAKYLLKLKYPKNANVFSNQEIYNVVKLNDQQNLATFKETPKMPPYLFSFLTGEFKYTSLLTKRNVVVRSIGIKEVENYLNKTTAILGQCLDSIESMFNFKYPLNKLDMFINPVYNGAFEDFGLIKIEADVLQLRMSAKENFYATNLICHEVAHQWFGNVVSVSSWNDLFLHESFATFISYRAMQKFTEDKNYVELEFLKAQQIGIEAMTKSDLPIAQNNPKFNDIVYESGAATLRMFEAIFGQQKFQDILNEYITKFYYKNVDYQAFVEVVDWIIDSPYLCGSLTIHEVLDDYFTQSQVPIIEIDLNDDNTFIIKHDKKWNVPLFLNDQNIVWILKNGSLCSSSNKLNFNSSPILNYKFYSFSIMQYSLSYWNKILLQDLSKIDEITLLGLVQNLDLQIKQEKSRTLKNVIQRLIKKIFHDLKGQVPAQLFEYLHYLNKKGQKKVIKLAYPHSNWNQSLSQDKDHFSSIVLYEAVKFNIEDARSKASQLFYEFMSDCKSFKKLKTCNRIEANSRKAVYSFAIYGKDEDLIKFLKNYKFQLKHLLEPYFYFKQEFNLVDDVIFEYEDL